MPTRALDWLHEAILNRYGWDNGVAEFCRRHPQFGLQQMHDLFRKGNRKPNVALAEALMEALDFKHLPSSWWGWGEPRKP